MRGPWTPHTAFHRQGFGNFEQLSTRLFAPLFLYQARSIEVVRFSRSLSANQQDTNDGQLSPTHLDVLRPKHDLRGNPGGGGADDLYSQGLHLTQSCLVERHDFESATVASPPPPAEGGVHVLSLDLAHLDQASFGI